MNYDPPLYRPPSESASLLLQVTVGCSHNKCVFCEMYRDKPFRIKPWHEIEEDIQEATRFRLRRVFLCDGDALILPQDDLVQILESIQESMPWVERVGTYADARSILRKSPEELQTLQQLGLGIIYHGIESGDDEVLKQFRKGSTAEQSVEAAERVIDAGITYSCMVLLGLGGMDRSQEHAIATAEILNRIQPQYVGVLSTMVTDGGRLDALIASGKFTLPGRTAMTRELRVLVEHLQLSNCLFTSAHASNHLAIRAVLPQDKPKTLAYIDKTLVEGGDDAFRPDFLRGL
jgi:coproporphyrinogen III oxidase-like Fe-S oxidoreductase